MEQRINDLNNRSWDLYHQGKSSEAYNSQKEACMLAKQYYGQENPNYAKILCNFGWLIHEINQGRESLHYCEQARAIFERAGWIHSNEYRMCMNNLATIYSSLGIDGALQLYESLLSTTDESENPLDYATILTNIGSKYNDLQRFTQALSCLSKAKTIYENGRAVKNPEYCGILNHIGLSYIGMGKYERSLYYFSQSIEILQENGLIMGPYYFASLNNSALAYQKIGDYKTAIEIYTYIGNVIRSTYGNDHLNITNIFDNLAGICIECNKKEKAAELIIKSSRINEKYLETLIGFIPEAKLNGPVNRFMRHISLFFSILQNWENAPQYYVDMAYNFSFQRKALVLDITAYRHKLLTFGSDDRLNSRIEQLIEKKSNFARMIYMPTESIDDPANYSNILHQLEEECNRLERDITYRLPHSFLKQIESIEGTSSIQNNLSADSFLIEYVRYHLIDFKRNMFLMDRYALFIIETGKDVQLIDLGPAKEIDDLILDLLQDITKATLNIPPSLKKLSDKILSPIIQVIAQKQNLIVIPDGLLHLLPFGILMCEDSYLIEKLSITYLSSSRDLVRDEGIDLQNQSAPIIIADPDYDLSYASGSTYKDAVTQRYFIENLGFFETLEGTREEGEAIHQIIGGNLWTATAALKEKLKKIKSPKILHIATHGFFSPDRNRRTTNWNSLFRSGLVLAGVNSFIAGRPLPIEAGDGIVTSFEVMDLNLSSTDIVVLSACDTGRGDILFGEGVFGFRRAFVIAGAKSLVMSLWAIPDEETKDLMVTFYSLLKSGKGKSESLREAQLWMKNRKSHPYYWGAFILQGDSGPIRWQSFRLH